MERASTVSIRAIAVAGVVYSVYLAWTVALQLDEAVLWAHLVRTPLTQSFRSGDAWSGLFYATVAKRFIGILRLSEFSLRAPAVLGGIVCALVVWRKPRPLFAVIYLAAAGLGWFASARSYGVALALCALEWYGLAIAVSPWFVLTLVYRNMERVVIPAVVTAFILLILPASHASPPQNLAFGSREAEAFRAGAVRLRSLGAVEVGAEPQVLPLLEFYRERYRRRDWKLVLQPGQGWWFSASGELSKAD